MRMPTAEEGAWGFVPSAKAPASPSIEYVREHGVIVLRSHAIATVEVAFDGAVNFCAVTLTAEGKIGDFVKRTGLQRYVQIVREAV